MRQLSIRIAGMLAFFLLCCVACTDHEPRPDGPVVNPQITTLRTSDFQGNVPPQMIPLGIGIQNLGNTPIVEYGVVWKIFEIDTPQTLPTVADGKTAFTLPATIGNHWQNIPFTVGELHYRAYAILQNGSVVYAGQAFSFD